MMLNEYIRINEDLKSSDFGLVISDKTIGLPNKQAIYENVPYYSGFYDFSTINGEVNYTDRTIIYF